MKIQLLTFLFLSCGSFVFSQLDSVQVQVAFENQAITPEPGDSAIQIQMLQTRIWVNDIDFLGQVMVSVYDQTTDTPLARIKYSAAEIQSQELMANGWITLNTVALQGQLALRVVTQLKDVNGEQLTPLSRLIQNY
jgi:hypothetical protein